MRSRARGNGPADPADDRVSCVREDVRGGATVARRRALPAAALAVLALALGACSTPTVGSAPGAPVAKPTPSPTTPAPSPTPEPELWPLTGVVVESDGADRPALSVKIENSAPARPQSGLEDADIVWEEMVEGGITRFNAAYHSTVPEALGPVRSIRPMDAAISGPLGGLLAFSGGVQPYIQKARDAGLQILTEDGGHAGFYRVSTRRAPHNLYGDGAELLAQADGSHKKPPAQQFAYAADSASASAVVGGRPAAGIDIRFPSTNPGWTWQADGDAGRGWGPGVWLRDEAGATQHAADGDPIVATNVVVLRVEVVITEARDVAGNRVPETILSGAGAAQVATGGHVVEATWSKAGDLKPLVLTGKDGKPVQLAPGSTWIELVPTSGGSVTVG
ncbi:hypothetical protein GCM10022262_15390 [Georgenia daeguensis]|uniref:DUF3048 domain-containing protein n=1 Tax=Georgenia daeguensis TaxID=908355 RepID=A0ABP8ET89_9MICO